MRKDLSGKGSKLCWQGRGNREVPQHGPKLYKLAILILTKPERAFFLQRLKAVLLPQVQAYSSMVTLVIDDSPMFKGRWHDLYDNLLSKGVDLADYVAFIDDDDLVSENYVSQLMEGINKGVDCCSLRGLQSVDGNHPTLFEYSSTFKKFTAETERYPYYWNCTRSSIAAQFRFTSEGSWARAHRMYHSGLLRTEHQIEPVIYFYEPRVYKNEKDAEKHLKGFTEVEGHKLSNRYCLNCYQETRQEVDAFAVACIAPICEFDRGPLRSLCQHHNALNTSKKKFFLTQLQA